jgi:DNA modification methylase
MIDPMQVGGARLFLGDCREVLPELARRGERFASVVTDPPYELGFMGKHWDRSGVAFDPATWTAVADCCLPGAVMLAFGGTRTWHRLACGIEDAGWSVRDTLLWLYGQGFPKSLDISKAIDKRAGAEREVLGKSATKARNSARHRDGVTIGKSWNGAMNDGHVLVTAPATPAAALWSGWGTALKPAWEPILLAMQPLDGTFADNALKHGVAGLNIDGTRVGTSVETWPKTRRQGKNGQMVYTPGSGSGCQTVGAGAMPTGRWPANLVLDEAAAALLDEQSGESKSNPWVAGGHKLGRQTYAQDAYTREMIRTEWVGPADSGGASRFFYVAKASPSERGAGNRHPTVKPLALMRWLCHLTRPPVATLAPSPLTPFCESGAGTVLDPFMGSGTTGLAAVLEGRPFVGIERDPAAFEIACWRLAELVAGERVAAGRLRSARRPARKARKTRQEARSRAGG